MRNGWIRVALCVLGVAAALAAVFATRPSVDNEAALTSIALNDDLNNAQAEGAPQQAVVNGWTAKDLLTLQSRQLDDLTSALWGLSWLVAITVGLLGLQAFNGRSGARPSQDEIRDVERPEQPVATSEYDGGAPQPAPVATSRRAPLI